MTHACRLSTTMTMLLFRHVLHYDVEAGELLSDVDLVVRGWHYSNTITNLKSLLIGFLVLRHSSLQAFVPLPIGVVLGC